MTETRLPLLRLCLESHPAVKPIPTGFLVMDPNSNIVGVVTMAELKSAAKALEDMEAKP